MSGVSIIFLFYIFRRLLVTAQEIFSQK